MKNIEESLLQAARKSGLSILELSKRSGLPYATAHGFIQDERRITLRSAAALAEVLGLELKPTKATKRPKRKGAVNG